MAQRPLVIAFDVIETLFPLEPVRQRMIDCGQPGHLLELWFTRVLRDAFALAAAGGHRPFAELAVGALTSVTGHTLAGDTVRGIVAGVAELDPHPDVEPAIRRARDAGVQVVTLTNGSVQTTTALLRRAGVDQLVQRVLSVDDIGSYKPAPAIYHHAAASRQVPPDRVALVAAHSWDIHGAHHAGLTTGWVSRLEHHYPPVFAAPDVTGPDLLTVVDGLLALPDSAGRSVQ